MTKALKLSGMAAFVFFVDDQPKDMVLVTNEAELKEKLNALAPAASFTGNCVSLGGAVVQEKKEEKVSSEAEEQIRAEFGNDPEMLLVML